MLHGDRSSDSGFSPCARRGASDSPARQTEVCSGALCGQSGEAGRSRKESHGDRAAPAIRQLQLPGCLPVHQPDRHPSRPDIRECATRRSPAPDPGDGGGRRTLPRGGHVVTHGCEGDSGSGRPHRIRSLPGGSRFCVSRRRTLPVPPPSPPRVGRCPDGNAAVPAALAGQRGGVSIGGHRHR